MGIILVHRLRGTEVRFAVYNESNALIPPWVCDCQYILFVSFPTSVAGTYR